jgi:DNA-binding HxlR family transcriptional regulator
VRVQTTSLPCRRLHKRSGSIKWAGDAVVQRSALELIGTHSAMVLLREAFWGRRRFDDLARRAGVTEQIAAKRLWQLVDTGLPAK